MTYYASKHGAGTANTIKAISDRKPFKSGGALSADTGNGYTGYLAGEALEAFYADRNAIDYIVYSYATPIAWHTTTRGWIYPLAKYSASTGPHQSLTRSALSGVGYTRIGEDSSQVAGKVEKVICHGHTRNGNPMMSVTLDNGKTYRISNDAGLVYEIENAEYRDESHVFFLTAAGRMSGYTQKAQD